VKAINADHKRATASALTMIACGSLSPCGGGILADLFNLHAADWKFQKPSCLRASHKTLENSFICAIIYFILLDPLSLFSTVKVNGYIGQLSARDCKAVIGLIMYQMNLIGVCFPLFELNKVNKVSVLMRSYRLILCIHSI
jgi:hypothetical protein